MANQKLDNIMYMKSDYVSTSKYLSYCSNNLKDYSVLTILWQNSRLKSRQTSIRDWRTSFRSTLARATAHQHRILWSVSFRTYTVHHYISTTKNASTAIHMYTLTEKDKDTVHQYQSKHKRKCRSVSQTPEHLLPLPPCHPAFSLISFFSFNVKSEKSLSASRKNSASLNQMVKRSSFLSFALRLGKVVQLWAWFSVSVWELLLALYLIFFIKAEYFVLSHTQIFNEVHWALNPSSHRLGPHSPTFHENLSMKYIH